MKDHKRPLFLILAVMLLLLYTNTGIASNPVCYLWLDGIEGNSMYKGETGCIEQSLIEFIRQPLDKRHVLLKWTCSVPDDADADKLSKLYDGKTIISHGKFLFQECEFEIQNFMVSSVLSKDWEISYCLEATYILNRDLPPTGDTVPVVLYGTLLAVSAATIILLRRKHSRL